MRFLVTLLFLFCFSFSIFAQDKPVEAKIIRTEDIKEPKKIALTAEESSRLTQLKMQAELDAQRARASQAEFESFYFQLNLRHKIDTEEWYFNFNIMQWVEKPQAQVAPAPQPTPAEKQSK